MEIEQFINRQFIPNYEKVKDKIGYSSFHWYRGTDARGNYEVFRMAQDATVEAFRSYTSSQNFTDITGPWKTSKDALARLGRTTKKGILK